MIRVHEGNYVVRALQYQQRVKFHETTQLLFFRSFSGKLGRLIEVNRC